MSYISPEKYILPLEVLGQKFEGGILSMKRSCKISALKTRVSKTY